MTGLDAWGASALPADMSEIEFTKKIIGLARQTGWLVTHFRPAPNRPGARGPKMLTHLLGHKGYPDLTLAKSGVVIFAELKATKGRLTDEQSAWLGALDDIHDTPTDPADLAYYYTHRAPDTIRRHHATVWRPADWPHIVQTLTAGGRRP